MSGIIDERPYQRNRVCCPVWLVWRPENGEAIGDAQNVRAIDGEEAAEDYAEWDDRNSVEYAIVGGSAATMHVRLASDEAAAVEVYVVTGESVPQYTARAVKS